MSTVGLPIAKAAEPIALLPRMANRHGLVAGATGTGKTVSLMVLAEGFSRLGVPVFMADVKGDLSGLAKAGGRPEGEEGAAKLGIQLTRAMSRGLLGSARRAGSSGPHHRV